MLLQEEGQTLLEILLSVDRSQTMTVPLPRRLRDRSNQDKIRQKSTQTRLSQQNHPKEFIFAEKLETIVFRGGGNTRMKDFHDLYSLVSLDVLDSSLAKKAVELVFHHRKTPVKRLPASFGMDALETMEKNWSAYRKKNKIKGRCAQAARIYRGCCFGCESMTG